MGVFLRVSTCVNSGAANLLNPFEACNRIFDFRVATRVRDFTLWVDSMREFRAHPYVFTTVLPTFFPFKASNSVLFRLIWTMLSFSIKKKK